MPQEPILFDQGGSITGGLISWAGPKDVGGEMDHHGTTRLSPESEAAYRAIDLHFHDLRLGNFRFAGTRPDDPNDIVHHEHRRELRALRVFAAWTNLTDLKSE